MLPLFRFVWVKLLGHGGHKIYYHICVTFLFKELFFCHIFLLAIVYYITKHTSYSRYLINIMVKFLSEFDYSVKT